MDGEGIIWLIAAGWVLLSWIMKTVRGAVNRTGQEPVSLEEKPDAHELRERRARLRAERARRRRLRSEQASGQTPLDDFRRELERVMGVHVEDEHGPQGRRATVGLESDEEVEEYGTLEEEPVVVSLERTVDRGPRVLVDHDSQAAELLRRRRAVAEANARPLTRADHQRFDDRIRAPAAVVKADARARRPASLRQAFVWSEILQKPVSER